MIASVVLGGYVNGYSIIQELNEQGVKNISLIQDGKQLAGFSNMVSDVITIDKTIESFKNALFKLKKKYEYLVLFPSSDIHIEFMKKIEHEIGSFCFLPYNSENIIECSDKYYQYQWCEKLGVPYPKTVKLESETDFRKCQELMFPLIVKPNTRKDITFKVFRNLYIEDKDDLVKKQPQVSAFLSEGFSFLVSEIIPGPSSGNIYAYTAYRSKSGKILNSWIGKKLTQYPDDYGVFSTSSNEAPEIIDEQGKRLVEGMNLYGIVEPEFKFDFRDGKYKLTEINLRSMMWHRTGNKSGVYLQYSQWLDATGKQVPHYIQTLDRRIHFSYLKHEIINCIQRKKYFKHFMYNLFKGDENHLAVFDSRDLKPFFYDLFTILKMLIRVSINILKNGKIA